MMSTEGTEQPLQDARRYHSSSQTLNNLPLNNVTAGSEAKTGHPKVYTWLCGLTASLGSVVFGYDMGVVAGVLPATDFISRMGPAYSNNNVVGLITSIFLLGAFIGMFPVAQCADRLGRRRTLQIGAAVYIFGGCLQVAAQNIGYMLSGRFLSGVGVGFMVDIGPVYSAEIAHPSIRGRLTTVQAFMIGFGALSATLLTYITSVTLAGSPAEWRLPLGIQLVPAIPLIVAMFLLPESPRWLAKRGNFNDARTTLARLHAQKNEEDQLVKSQFEDIMADLARSNQFGESTWRELFVVPSNFRRVCLGFVLQFATQMTGSSVINYYSTTLFTEMGFTTSRILLFQTVYSIIGLIGMGACVAFVDRLGRRGPLIVANVACGICFAVMALLLALFPGSVDNPAAHYIFIIFTWIFIFFFSSCLGTLSWAYPAEIFSTRTRAKSTAVTSAAAWLSNFFIAQITPVAFAAIGWKYYLVFAICGQTNALVMWAFYPETTGRRLEEMDAVFVRAPLFVAGTQYAHVKDHRAAERELRTGNFLPGELTERTRSKTKAFALEQEDVVLDIGKPPSKPPSRRSRTSEIV